MSDPGTSFGSHLDQPTGDKRFRSAPGLEQSSLTGAVSGKSSSGALFEPTPEILSFLSFRFPPQTRKRLSVATQLARLIGLKVLELALAQCTATSAGKGHNKLTVHVHERKKEREKNTHSRS